MRATSIPRGGRSLALALSLAACACGAEPSDGLTAIACETAEIKESRANANPTNVLSASVFARVGSADSVLARFGRQGDPMASVTASVVTGTRAAADALNDTIVVPVLGLLPQTAYALQLVAFNGCGIADGAPLAFTTGALPADLPGYSASGTSPTPGFVSMNAGPYGVVIDNTGRVVWYRRFSNGPGLNFQPQPTGRYAVRPPTVASDTGSWLELDVLGNVVRSFRCARGLEPRFHDLIALPDSTYWVLCDETRTMDLTAYGGVAAARVTGTVVQHIRANGTPLFEWSAFDHFAITDLDSLDRLGSVVNWTHGNAIDLDRDGNLVVSFRSLSEITKIDARSGAVLWRMGGRASGFALTDPGAPLFVRQHGVRVTTSGDLQLLDNLGDPHASRVKRLSFRPDSVPPAVWPAQVFESQPPVVAMLGGSTQELPNGHVLAAYGSGNRVAEYDAAGNVVWQLDGNPGYVFRAHRFPSLYKPGVGYHR